MRPSRIRLLVKSTPTHRAVALVWPRTHLRRRLLVAGKGATSLVMESLPLLLTLAAIKLLA